MIRNLENKDASATRETLIARFLESPLAAQLERSLSNGVDAARRRATTALDDLKAKHEKRHAQLSTKARELTEKRDALAREHEAARLAALVAIDAATEERHEFARRRAELESLATARASYLTERGLDSAEAVERHFGI